LIKRNHPAWVRIARDASFMNVRDQVQRSSNHRGKMDNRSKKKLRLSGVLSAHPVMARTDTDFRQSIRALL
jgi:hypothetical protein